MEKRLTCRLFGYDCDFVVRNESEEALLKDFADHLGKMHKVTFTKEIRDKAKTIVREAA